VAQINLLKQSSTASNTWDNLPKILARLLIFVLIILVGYYAWLVIDTQSIASKTTSTQAEINLDKQKALSTAGRGEVLTRQLQLKDFQDLLAQHLYWSQLMPVIADATLKKATYSSLKVDGEGLLTLAVNVPTLEDLDKYLQVFDLPQVNKYFSNVRISSYRKVQGPNSTGIAFEVNMNYNKSVIKYNAPAASDITP
jgi:hypothetical protein